MNERLDQYSFVIVGAGGIGRAVGLLLRELGDFDSDLYFGDISEAAAKSAVDLIVESSEMGGVTEHFVMPKEGSDDEMDAIFKKCDIVLDCLPGSQAPRIARMAREHKLHYVNLTEYVKETEEIMEIAEGAETAFVLQTGLAPGFICVLANALCQEFMGQYNTDKVEHVRMRVGALTRSTRSPHFYGFTWSPIGVATEYIKPSVVIRDYKKTTLPSLSGRETLIVGGITYEEALTSGGAADLPDYFQDIARNLDYKTLRFPGHYQWVQDILDELPEGANRIAALEKTMLENIPATEDDFVVIFSSVEGIDGNDGRFKSIEQDYFIIPAQVGTHVLRAIQTTTAAPMAECARMVLKGGYKGVVKQSDLDPMAFLLGPFVSAIYNAGVE